MNVFVSAQLATLKMPRPVVLSKKMYLASPKVSFQNLSKVKWVVLGQNEKFDLYLDNGNEPFY